jgi:DNA-binding transcriptional LysR family regulator
VVLANIAMLQFQELRERNVDLLIGRMPQPFVEDDLTAEVLFDEPFLAVTGMRSRWARQRQVRFDELIGEPWVLPPYDSTPGPLIAEIFRASGLQPPQPSIVTLSVQLTVTLIASGRFVGLLPSSVAQYNARRVGLKLVPVKLPATRFAAGIITVKGRTLSPLAELFIECARETARSIREAIVNPKARSG